jgi:arylsulfatase A-like enzyme
LIATRRTLLAGLLALCACKGGAPGSARQPLPSAAPERPNIVLFLLDAVRADHVPAYGHPRERMPFLARIAEQGVVFERAYASSSWTPSSMASIFTGLWVNQHGVLTGFQATKRALREGEDVKLNRMPSGVVTLPEMLKQAGYRTFGAADNINIGEPMGFSRGFDRFSGVAQGGLHGRAAEWKAELRGASSPFFLYLHYMDAHDLGKTKRRKGQSKNDARREEYAAALRSLDDKIRFVIKTLGLDDGRTLVLVTADHGEEFMDHGGEGHWNKLYEELVRVPLVAYWPGRLAPARVKLPVASVDLMPTLREVALAPASGDDAGVSLLATLRGEVAEPRAFFPMRWWNASDVRYVRKAVVHGGHKYIVGLPEREEELYDLEADPQERTNLVATRAELAAQLRDRLRAFEAKARVHPREFALPVSISREQAEELKALGYVQ